MRSVVDVEDKDGALWFVDAEQHAVVAAARTAGSFEFIA